MELETKKMKALTLTMTLFTALLSGCTSQPVTYPTAKTPKEVSDHLVSWCAGYASAAEKNGEGDFVSVFKYCTDYVIAELKKPQQKDQSPTQAR